MMKDNTYKICFRKDRTEEWNYFYTKYLKGINDIDFDLLKNKIFDLSEQDNNYALRLLNSGVRIISLAEKSDLLDYHDFTKIFFLVSLVEACIFYQNEEQESNNRYRKNFKEFCEKYFSKNDKKYLSKCFNIPNSEEEIHRTGFLEKPFQFEQILDYFYDLRSGFAHGDHGDGFGFRFFDHDMHKNDSDYYEIIPSDKFNIIHLRFLTFEELKKIFIQALLKCVQEMVKQNGK